MRGLIQSAMNENLKNTLKEVRSRAGLTQEQLADAVSVSRQTIISIEKGKYAPSIVLALRLAKYFKVSVETIFYE